MIDLETFQSFPKIPRLYRECIITEKIDGTNAQVCVLEDGRVLAGSRNRWITPENDNYDFAKWVNAYAEELKEGLGVGRHYGEWWGTGINRKYNTYQRQFYLFNVLRWNEERPAPSCCGVVPLLYRADYSDEAVQDCLSELRERGSRVAPGFTTPEGVVVHMVKSGHNYKVLLEKDDKPKGLIETVNETVV